MAGREIFQIKNNSKTVISLICRVSNSIVLPSLLLVLAAPRQFEVGELQVLWHLQSQFLITFLALYVSEVSNQRREIL